MTRFKLLITLMAALISLTVAAPTGAPFNTLTHSLNPANALLARSGTAVAFKNIWLNCNDAPNPKSRCGLLLLWEGRRDPEHRTLDQTLHVSESMQMRLRQERQMQGVEANATKTKSGGSASMERHGVLGATVMMANICNSHRT